MADDSKKWKKKIEQELKLLKEQKKKAESLKKTAGEMLKLRVMLDKKAKSI